MFVLPAGVGIASAACVYVAVREWRAAAHDHDEAAWAAVARAIRRTTARGNDVLRSLASAGDVRGPARDLVLGLADAPSRAHAVALLNETVADLRREFDATSGHGRAAARISAAVGGAAALVALSDALRPGSGMPMAIPLLCLALGGTGALASAVLARQSLLRRRLRRAAVSEAVAALGRACGAGQDGQNEGFFPTRP